MIITDVLGIIAIIFMFVLYMVVTPMFERKNDGKNGKNPLDEMAKKIKDVVNWVNRQ